MKIYTKTGDDGTTSLFGGTRVMKSNLRVEAYGNIDELNSFLGLLIVKVTDPDMRDYLQKIQHILFNIGSIVATVDKKYEEKLPSLNLEDITSLEATMDKYDSELPIMTNFILPGGDESVAMAHVCRTVCRRTERKLVELSENEIIGENIKHSIRFLNRLSDYFFVISRKLTQLNNTNEVIWKKDVSL